MKVKLKIKATVTDLVLAESYAASVKDGCFTADDGRVLPFEMISEVCDEVIEYGVDGEYIVEDEGAILRYREPDSLGCENAVTELIFGQADRSVLTMVRSGDMTAAFRFDKNDRRQLCSYETPFMPVEFTVNTRRLDNTVSFHGGRIEIDYFLEIRGVNTERNRLVIEVLSQ